MQSAYEIRVSDSPASLSKGTMWGSGKANSDQSLFVPYGGKPSRLAQASSEYKTGYSLVKSSWKTNDETLNFDIEVPANTKAVVLVPATTHENISESGKALTASKEISVIGKEGKYIKLETGSGKCSFVVKK
jgi:hypothetical protein